MELQRLNTNRIWHSILGGPWQEKTAAKRYGAATTHTEEEACDEV